MQRPRFVSNSLKKVGPLSSGLSSNPKVFPGTFLFDKRMPQIEILGLVAGMFVALGLVPQILRVWRLKSAREISLSFNLFSLIGTTLWLAYGLFLGLTSLIVWNGANDALLILLLTMKLRYGMNHST